MGNLGLSGRAISLLVQIRRDLIKHHGIAITMDSPDALEQMLEAANTSHQPMIKQKATELQRQLYS